MRTYAQKRQFNLDNPFGTPLSRKLRTNRADYRRRVSIPGGGAGRLTFVLSAQLLEIIQPALDQIVHEQRDDPTVDHDAANGTMMLARRACIYTDRNPEAIVRRLFALKDGREKTTDLAIADELCLAANNPFGVQLIHVFPRQWRGAQEVADAWAYARDVHTTAKELDEIAAETLEIARAVWHRPERQICCSPEAFDAIGGEPSQWLTTTGR